MLHHEYSGDVHDRDGISDLELSADHFLIQGAIDCLTQNATYPADVEYAIRLLRDALKD